MRSSFEKNGMRRLGVVVFMDTGRLYPEFD